MAINLAQSDEAIARQLGIDPTDRSQLGGLTLQQYLAGATGASSLEDYFIKKGVAAVNAGAKLSDRYFVGPSEGGEGAHYAQDIILPDGSRLPTSELGINRIVDRGNGYQLVFTAPGGGDFMFDVTKDPNTGRFQSVVPNSQQIDTGESSNTWGKLIDKYGMTAALAAMTYGASGGFDAAAAGGTDAAAAGGTDAAFSSELPAGYSYSAPATTTLGDVAGTTEGMSAGDLAAAGSTGTGLTVPNSAVAGGDLTGTGAAYSTGSMLPSELQNAAITGGTAAAGSTLASILPYTAGASLVGSYLQSKAAKDAANTQSAAAQQAIAQQQANFNTINAQQAPYRGAGYQGLNAIRAMLPGQNVIYDENGKAIGTGIGTDYLTHQFNASDLAAGLAPNYDFMLQQGQMANQRAANVAGGALGGNALQGLQKYTQDYAGNAYQNAFNNYQAQRGNIYNTLASIAGIGQTGQTQTNTAATNATNAATQLGIGSAAAQAAGTTGSANAYGNALNNITNQYTLAQLLGQRGNVIQPLQG